MTALRLKPNAPALQTESWLVAAGRPAAPGDPLNAPPILASNFAFDAEAGYARDDGTQTWRALEAIVGGLEGGEAVAFSSGMAAASAVLDLIPCGGRVALPEDCYQGVATLAQQAHERGHLVVHRIATADTPAWLAAARDADLLWLESPSNPLLRIADLVAICKAERKPGALVAVDNTFATPLNQQPLLLGADLVVHSATKFFGGHSDLLSGIAVGATQDLRHRLAKCRTLRGATPGALESYLTVRGLRTLALRLAAAQENAAELAEFLAARTTLERVRYPGLESHPDHALAKRQLRGFGTIVTFEVAGGAAAADHLCKSLQLVRHATSLGAVESTIERRAAIPGQEHLPPGLVRLSVGIESIADLQHDFAQALG